MSPIPPIVSHRNFISLVLICIIDFLGRALVKNLLCTIVQVAKTEGKYGISEQGRCISV